MACLSGLGKTAPYSVGKILTATSGIGTIA